MGDRWTTADGTLLPFHSKGLTGFDVSDEGRECDPSCSDSQNGATTRIADEQFALAA